MRTKRNIKGRGERVEANTGKRGYVNKDVRKISDTADGRKGFKLSRDGRHMRG